MKAQLRRHSLHFAACFSVNTNASTLNDKKTFIAGNLIKQINIQTSSGRRREVSVHSDARENVPEFFKSKQQPSEVQRRRILLIEMTFSQLHRCNVIDGSFDYVRRRKRFILLRLHPPRRSKKANSSLIILLYDRPYHLQIRLTSSFFRFLHTILVECLLGSINKIYFSFLFL